MSDKTFGFETALECMKADGTKWRRQGWNPGGYIYLQNNSMLMLYMPPFEQVIVEGVNAQDLLADDWVECFSLAKANPT